MEHPAHEGIGLFRSTDAGEHWERLGAPFSNVFFVEADPGDDRVLYVATADGLFRTRDGGDSWSNVFPHRTRALLSHPEADGVVFAGTQRYDGYWDLFVSGDGGDTWAQGNLTIKMGRGPGSRDYDGINRAGRDGEKGHIMDLAVDASRSHLVAATRGAGLWRGDISRLFE